MSLQSAKSRASPWRTRAPSIVWIERRRHAFDFRRRDHVAFASKDFDTVRRMMREARARMSKALSNAPRSCANWPFILRHRSRGRVHRPNFSPADKPLTSVKLSRAPPMRYGRTNPLAKTKFYSPAAAFCQAGCEWIVREDVGRHRIGGARMTSDGQNL
jgi:hypothetical protein